MVTFAGICSILHLLREPAELSQRLCHDDSTINTSLVLVLVLLLLALLGGIVMCHVC